MRDSLDREISYLRISVTDLCNLRCLYCMPEEGVQKKCHQDILSLEEFAKIVNVSTQFGISKLRITGGEPLLRKNLPWLIENVSQAGKLKDISLTTNGLLLKSKAVELKNAGLMRVNISLDTLKKDRYEYITRGGNLFDVLEAIKMAREIGLTPIKINTVLVGGFNDDEIEDMAGLLEQGWIDELRFIELMPIGQASGWTKERFVSNDVVRERLGLVKALESRPGSSAARYEFSGGGVVGLIDPISHSFCSSCNRLRVTADGKLKPCLLTDQEVDIKKALREGSDEDLINAFKIALRIKGAESKMIDGDVGYIKRDMFRIGG